MSSVVFSKKWISSKKPSKQRKYRMNAPLHIKAKFLNVHLAKDLRQKYGKRSMRARKGDKVKIVRGKFKGKEGKIERVSIKKTKLYVTGVEFTKKDGAKVLVPIEPSNCILTELDMSDKKRKKIFQRQTKQENVNKVDKNEKSS